MNVPARSTEPTRSRLLLANVLSWTCGILLLLGAFLLLDQLIPDGPAKTTIRWVLAAIAVTLFGGLPLSPRRVRRRQ